MRKKLSTITKILITSLFVIGGTITANAGQWKQNNTGWWYQNDDGSYLKSGWQWVDGKCYYFSPEGYCLINTSTPDGYQVDLNGAWVLNGVVQSKRDTDSKNNIQLSQESVDSLTALANITYDAKNDPYHSKAFDINIKDENLSSEEKAFILYWYQYQYGYVDGRLSVVESGSSLNYEAFHTVHPDDLRDMMKEILGDCSDNDMNDFEKNYVEKKSNGLYYMNCTGDFGDAGVYYLSSENASYSIENGLLKIIGNVVQYQSTGNKYLPAKTYTAYFVPNSNSYITGYQFKQLIVQ